MSRMERSNATRGRYCIGAAPRHLLLSAVMMGMLGQGGLAAGQTAPAGQNDAGRDDPVVLPPPDEAADGTLLDPADARIQAMIDKANQLTGTADRQRRCAALGGAGQDIVVCGTDEDTRYRVPADTTGRLATGGPPPAPDVAGDGIFRGEATMGNLCVIPPCPPPPAYFIDYSKLPEVDQAYLERAREAEAAERARQERETGGDPPPP